MKILVRGTNWIGDAVMTIPALRELRRIFPLAHITLHTRSWAEGIFRDADFVDELLTFDESNSNFRTLFTEAHRLRARRFDLGIIFPNSYRSAAIAKLGRISRRFGFAREGRSLLLTDAIRIPRWKKERHEVFYYLQLIEEVEKRVLGCETIAGRPPETALGISDARKARAREKLNDAGLCSNRKIVAIGAGSTNSRAKRWGSENFAALAVCLAKDFDAGVILLGSREETEISSRVLGLAEGLPIDLTGKTNLAEAVAILAAIDLFISNDMGLAHVAAAAGTPTIVIFGPTNPETTRPIGPNVQIARNSVECAPCMLRDCPIDHRCMTGLSVEYVFEMAAELLSASFQ